MKNYAITLFPSSGDGGWIADVPDLHYCSAFGETPEDALREVKAATRAWLATARKNRRPIPRPRRNPLRSPVSSVSSVTLLRNQGWNRRMPP